MLWQMHDHCRTQNLYALANLGQVQCYADIKKMQMPPGDKSIRVTVFASKLEAWLRFAGLPYRIDRSATLKGAPKGQVCQCHA